MRSCTGISASVRSSPPRVLYFCVLPCGASLTGLCAVRVSPAFVRCEPTKTLCFGVLYELRELFVRCEPTKALRFCVPYERQELCAVRAYKGFVPLCTVRAPRALRGASLQRLCASVCCRSFTSFVRCEPTKAFYGVRGQTCIYNNIQQKILERGIKGAESVLKPSRAWGGDYRRNTLWRIDFTVFSGFS